jgi:hypothetical protein
MKTCKGSRCLAPLILNLGAKCRGLVSFTPWPLYPQKRTQYTLKHYFSIKVIRFSIYNSDNGFIQMLTLLRLRKMLFPFFNVCFISSNQYIFIKQRYQTERLKFPSRYLHSNPYHIYINISSDNHNFSVLLLNIV